MAAAFLLVPAVPASAHIENFSIEDVSGFDITGNDGWVYTHANGSITCAEGERFLVTAKVIDDDFIVMGDPFIGKGRTKGTCTGETQGWVMTLEQRSGSGFGDGCYERAAAKAHTKVNGVPHDEAVDVAAPNCA